MDEFDELRSVLAKPPAPPPQPIPDRWKYDPTHRTPVWERYGMWCLVGGCAIVMLAVYAMRGPVMVEDPNFRQAGENAERLMENRWIDSGLGKGGTPRASTGVLGVSEPRPGVYLVVGGFFEPKTKTEGEWLARVRRRGTYWELVDASP